MIKWLILLILLLFVYHVREVFPPFIVGAIFAYLLAPLVKMLNEKLRLAPFWSVLVIYSLAGTLLGCGAYYLLPDIADQAKDIFANKREVVGNLVQQLSTAFGMNLNIEQTTDLLLAEAQTSVGKPEELMHIGGIVSKSLLSLLVCFVTSIYMLVDSKRVGRFFLRFIPIEKRATVVSLSGQMDIMFRKYVWGQAFLITFMSFVAFCILSYFHLKYALLIAITTGFLEIVPVLGPLIAILIATGFGVAQLGLAKAGGIALAYWVARLLEDYVVVPNTIGHAVELHPLAVIFAVVVGETMAGALGMLIAIPVAAAIKVVLDFCYPATSIIGHHEKKNPLSWMVDMFKSPPSAAAEQALLDAQAIQYMREGTSGTGAMKEAGALKEEHKTRFSEGGSSFSAADLEANPAASSAPIDSPAKETAASAPTIVPEKISPTATAAAVAQSHSPKSVSEKSSASDKQSTTPERSSKVSKKETAETVKPSSTADTPPSASEKEKSGAIVKPGSTDTNATAKTVGSEKKSQAKTDGANVASEKQPEPKTLNSEPDSKK